MNPTVTLTRIVQGAEYAHVGTIAHNSSGDAACGTTLTGRPLVATAPTCPGCTMRYPGAGGYTQWIGATAAAIADGEITFTPHARCILGHA